MSESGAGAKAFGGIMAVFAILGVTCGVVASITIPMAQRIDQLERQIHAHVEERDHPLFQTEGIERNREAIRQIVVRMEEDDQRERDDTAALADLNAHLSAVDKTASADTTEARRRLAVIEGWITEHDLRVVGLNAAQWERIRALERNTYGEPPPSVEYNKPVGSPE